MVANHRLALIGFPWTEMAQARAAADADKIFGRLINSVYLIGAQTVTNFFRNDWRIDQIWLSWLLFKGWTNFDRKVRHILTCLHEPVVSDGCSLACNTSEHDIRHDTVLGFIKITTAS